MTMRLGVRLRRMCEVGGLLMLAAAPECVVAEPPAAAVAAFHAYVGMVEARLARQHGVQAGFVVGRPSEEVVVERLTPPAGPGLEGALLHHWRGTVFVPGGTAAGVERLLRDFAGYPRTFAPQVLRASVLVDRGDRLQGEMRVRQKHVITVVMDTAYDIAFGRLDAAHGFSASRSTWVAEIAGAGSAGERQLGPEEEHGFLWRQNTYWSYAERDGGVVVQVESVSLSRGVPRGLGWAVGPFVESVPRESLEFTLQAVRRALRR